MEHLTTPDGIRVSFDRLGTGPPLVLVHGSFSDHHTNWEFVKQDLAGCFTVYAVARRGRGETTATVGHGLEDESRDVVAVLHAIGEPVFLLGHSYGAHCALAAARQVPDRVRTLVAYEAVWPSVIGDQALARLEVLASREAWDDFTVTFFRDVLLVPVAEVESVRASALWPPIVADAPASLGDIRALNRYAFDPASFRGLALPVLLQIGSESPRELYVTDALAAVLPDARIDVLEGQAHEGMTTAPAQYVRSVTRFLLGSGAPFTESGA